MFSRKMPGLPWTGVVSEWAGGPQEWAELTSQGFLTTSMSHPYKTPKPEYVEVELVKFGACVDSSKFRVLPGHAKAHTPNDGTTML